ncbi:MAG: ferritin [Caldisericaceae bacterium]
MAGNLYEDQKAMGEKAMDFHRAISSLMEELEAIDYYNQRIAVTTDEDLKKILIHNRDEEKEHAAMLIEYLRRIDPKFEHELKDYLFTSKDFGEMG